MEITELKIQELKEINWFDMQKIKRWKKNEEELRDPGSHSIVLQICIESFT